MTARRRAMAQGSRLADRTARLATDLQLFAKRYGRPAQRNGADPNDRRHDRRIAARLRHMDPQQLDALLRGEDQD